MTIDMSPASVRAGALPGYVMRPDPGRVSVTYRARAAVNSEYTALWTGAFNGTRLLGIYIDGGLYEGITGRANTAAFIAAINTQLDGKAVLSEPVAGTYKVVFPDALPHVLTPYIPDDPDLSLGAFSLTAGKGVPSPLVKGGMAVAWYDRTLRIVQAVTPTTTALQYAGMVDRGTVLSKQVTMQWGLTEGALVNGQEVRAHLKHASVVRPYPGLTIVQGDPVYIGRTTGEEGYYFNADDGGNTRLIIAGAQWMQSGTSAADQGMQAMFT